MMALSWCQEVHVYGFGDTQMANTSSRMQYHTTDTEPAETFDPANSDAHTHSWVLEELALQYLERSGWITRHL